MRFLIRVSVLLEWILLLSLRYSEVNGFGCSGGYRLPRGAKHLDSDGSRLGTGLFLDPNGQQEFRNVVTEVLSNFMRKEELAVEDTLADIDFAAPKLAQKLDLDRLASVLDAELIRSEWFVTGRVNPIYFAETFEFQDPDVKLKGIEAYARGVNKLFDQTCSRAEIISTKVNSTVPNTITCTWRLSGKANIGPGLTIKPYVVYTDFTINDGLIVFQQDSFDLPQWDILLSSLFPFLIGKITAPAAPPVPPRQVLLPELPKPIVPPMEMFQKIFKKPDQ